MSMKFFPEFQISGQKAFEEGLLKLMSKQKNLVVLTAGISDSIGLQNIKRLYSDRFFSFGNQVENMLGAACGFAARGKLPVVCANASRLMGKGCDIIRSYIAHPNLNVKIVAYRSGLLNSEEGAVFQSTDDLAMLSNIANLEIFVPSDVTETRKVTDKICEDYGPTFLRLMHLPLPDLYDSTYQFEIGHGDVYKAGSDVCIFSYGICFHMALEGAQLCERDGISTMVVNMSSISPFDANLVVECAKSVSRVFTVEDHNVAGGLGTKVMEALATSYPMKVTRLGVNGVADSAKVDDLFSKYSLDAKGIWETVKNSIN